MRLYVLRHGIAAEREEWAGSDAERPLTAQGRKAMQHAARGMEQLGVRPGRILTSPLKRAHETAQIVAEQLKPVELLEDARLGTSFDLQCLTQLLHQHGNDEALMLVGHEPDLSRTIGEAIGGARIILKKGGLARIDFDDVSSMRGALVWLMPPKALTR